jgi:hypothetical protein
MIFMLSYYAPFWYIVTVVHDYSAVSLMPGKHTRFRTKFTAWAYWQVTKYEIHTPTPVTNLIWRRRPNTADLRIKMLPVAWSLCHSAFSWCYKPCDWLILLSPSRTMWLEDSLTPILLTWRIWWASNNTSKWQVGFNSAFKGLTVLSQIFQRT